MPNPLSFITSRRTLQSAQADSRQRENHAGGFTFVVDPDTRLRRFLTIGTESGTYYTGEHELTKENAAVVLDAARTRATDLVSMVVEISVAGRAPKQNPALFALAAAAKLGDEDGRRAAHAAVPLVCRTGTHLFLFAGYLEQFGGWGRGTRRAIGNWYADPERSVTDIAYQAVKYRRREGWVHRDLLRLSHPRTDEPARRQLFDWISGRTADLGGLPLVSAFERAQAATSAAEIRELVEGNRALAWEMIPDRFLNEPSVWEALLQNGLPQGALMRQLPRLTRLGLLEPMGQWAGPVSAQLADPKRLRKAHMHPINVLVAQRTYASGRSARGEGMWSPSRPIVDALDAAFYAAFGVVVPTGRRTMLAMDVSGSMTSPVGGMPVSCREASAALALVTAATESRYEIVGFTARGGMWSGNDTELMPLAIGPRQRLDDALRTVGDLPFGRTDCALPMIHAEKTGLEIDTFVVYTDNETWAGSIHPHQALASYRRATGIPARLVVVGMTATEFSIADPSDAGMLDIAGFDAAVPSIIGDFSRGL